MITFNDAFGAGGGGSARLWVSGATVKQYDSVISPLDGEIYRRKTATGAGDTDPANDLTNYIAVTYRRCRALAGPSSAIAQSGGSSAPSLATLQANGVRLAVAPTISAGVRTQVVSVIGRGRAKYAGMTYRVNGAYDTDIRFEIIIDGRRVLDYTGNNSSTAIAYPTWVVIGGLWLSGNNIIPSLDEIQFRRSFEFYVTPSAWMGSSWNFMYAYDEEA